MGERKTPMAHSILRFGYNWVTQVFDPFRVARGLSAFWYFRDLAAYAKLPGAEPIHLLALHPQLHERHTEQEMDAHYFYVNAWAMRRVVAGKPSWHLDIASQTSFGSMLSAVIPTIYLDYRLLRTNLGGLTYVQGDILHLPFETGSVNSVSCLHVAEHIGLGRYGDPLNPSGTREAASELERILSTGGELFFAVPVGRPRICFNAHRIHSAETIREYFSGLSLMEFSGVHDNGRFAERVSLTEFTNSNYALGMFWFRKL